MARDVWYRTLAAWNGYVVARTENGTPGSDRCARAG